MLVLLIYISFHFFSALAHHFPFGRQSFRLMVYGCTSARGLCESRHNIEVSSCRIGSHQRHRSTHLPRAPRCTATKNEIDEKKKKRKKNDCFLCFCCHGSILGSFFVLHFFSSSSLSLSSVSSFSCCGVRTTTI